MNKQMIMILRRFDKCDGFYLTKFNTLGLSFGVIDTLVVKKLEKKSLVEVIKTSSMLAPHRLYVMPTGKGLAMLDKLRLEHNP